GGPVEERHPDATVTTVQVAGERDQLIAPEGFDDLPEATGSEPDHLHADPLAGGDHELVEAAARQVVGDGADGVAVDRRGGRQDVPIRDMGGDHQYALSLGEGTIDPFATLGAHHATDLLRRERIHQ